MTQTHQTHAVPQAPPGRPVPAPAGPRERRVRFGHLALAIALVVVGALGTTTLVLVASAESEYLALARDVPYGAQFSEQDLVRVRVGSPPGLDPVPAAEVARVIGNYATMPLAASSLLTWAHVTEADGREPGPGEVRVGITVRGDRLPGRPVRPGHQVLLVDTARSGTGSDADPGATAPRTWEATVVGVAGEDGSGIFGGGSSQTTTIDVIVPAGDGATIAGLAAANELSVAVLPDQE